MKKIALVFLSLLIISCFSHIARAADDEDVEVSEEDVRQKFSETPKPEKRPLKDQQHIEGVGNFVHPAVTQLHTCRDNSNETLGMWQCYHDAVNQVDNYTWWASYALLSLRCDMPFTAYEAMNMSVNMWLKYEIQPHLEKIGKDQTQMTWVDLLRWVHDDESRGAKARESEAKEMGMLIAKWFELQHKPSEAHAVYYGFLLQAGLGESQLVDFHRRTGNLVGMINHGGNVTSIVHRVSESISPLVDGFQEHMMSLGDHPEEVTNMADFRRMCGTRFETNNNLWAKKIIEEAGKCVLGYGNYTETMSKEPEELASIALNWVNESSIHHLAQLGATDILDQTLEERKGQYFSADRFGRGAMHHAAAFGHAGTVKMLLQRGGNIDLQDRGGVTPRHLGCSSPLFREEVDDLIKDLSQGDQCATYERHRQEDEDIEITDDSGTDGGWNPKNKRPRYLHCDFDVRDASQINQIDVLIGYLQSNQPLVLRNAFFDSDGPDLKWLKKNFNRSYHKLHIRDEEWIRGEKFNIGQRSKVTTIGEFLQTLENGDGHSGVALIDHENHAMNSITYDWAPASFTNKKRHDEIQFFEPKLAVPTLMMLKKGSKKPHLIQAQASFHTLVYGHEEWWVMPPKYARAIRGHVPQQLQAFAQRCELYTGDVLVLPDMWSASFVSKANGIAMERPLYKRMRIFPGYKKGGTDEESSAKIEVKDSTDATGSEDEL